MSITEQLMKAALGQMTRDASTKTGVSSDMVAKLMPMAMAAVLGGLQKNVQQPGGAEALAKALAKHDGGLLDNPSNVARDDVLDDGRRILGHVLGGKQGATEMALAKAAGVSQDQIAKILAMAAPAVLAGLGKAKREQDLDAGALAGLVKKEAANVQKAAPNDLSGLLRFIDADGDGNVVEDIMGLASKGLGGFFNKR